MGQSLKINLFQKAIKEIIKFPPVIYNAKQLVDLDHLNDRVNDLGQKWKAEWAKIEAMKSYIKDENLSKIMYELRRNLEDREGFFKKEIVLEFGKKYPKEIKIMKRCRDLYTEWSELNSFRCGYFNNSKFVAKKLSKIKLNKSLQNKIAYDISKSIFITIVTIDPKFLNWSELGINEKRYFHKKVFYDLNNFFREHEGVQNIKLDKNYIDSDNEIIELMSNVPNKDGSGEMVYYPGKGRLSLSDKMLSNGFWKNVEGISHEFTHVLQWSRVSAIPDIVMDLVNNNHSKTIPHAKRLHEQDANYIARKSLEYLKEKLHSLEV